MDLKYTVEEEEFRREVRAWIAENLPEEFKVSSDGGLTATRQTRRPSMGEGTRLKLAPRSSLRKRPSSVPA